MTQASTTSTSVRPLLRRLSRRVAIGLFLEIWPRWAAASLVAGGLIALICRLLFPNMAGILPWLWLAPAIASIPAVVIWRRQRLRPAEIHALADSLCGGDGTLLAVLETKDATWEYAAGFSASNFVLPRFHLWRKLGPAAAAAVFLFAALLMPQHAPARGNSALANDVVADVRSAMLELKKRDLITPSEEKQLEEEIERIRKSASERLDSSSWEAADSLREKMAADVSQKADALKWAQSALASGEGASSANQNEELGKAIDKLAKAGLLADAPPELQRLLGGKDAIAGGTAHLPDDFESLRRLKDALSEHLAGRTARYHDLARATRETGRFNPADFPLECEQPAKAGESSESRVRCVESPETNGRPGSGGVNRGRADAPLTWGDESLPFDRFKAVALPPGSVRNPDDWAPVASLPGAPQISPQASVQSTGRAYASTSGGESWRRSLAPRHYSAVKNYFDKDSTAEPKHDSRN